MNRNVSTVDYNISRFFIQMRKVRETNMVRARPQPHTWANECARDSPRVERGSSAASVVCAYARRHSACGTGSLALPRQFWFVLCHGLSCANEGRALVMRYMLACLCLWRC